MKREDLRKIIREEALSILQDDAIFNDRSLPGVLDSFDHPGDDNSDMGRNLSYGHTKSSDHEGRSTKKQLYYLFRKSQSLYDMLRDDDDLPEWVQSKVSRAADKIQSVYQYLEYKIHHP
tara:strand:- start:202 stop:558 length:357 start_codon:yes stop_codon:yes gene_type:complete